MTTQIQANDRVVSTEYPLPVSAVAGTPAAATAATVTALNKAVATPGTPVPLTAAATYAAWFSVKAMKAAHAANTGLVWIGDATIQNFELVQTEWRDFPPIPGKFYNLGAIYIDAANAADGVTVLYGV